LVNEISVYYNARSKEDKKNQLLGSYYFAIIANPFHAQYTSIPKVLLHGT